MPSGFQQDQNQLTPSYYRVNITCGDNNAQWYAVGDGDGANSEGRVSTYSWDNFEGGDRPTTQATADALARGNLRFQAIVEALSNLADCQILDIEESANANGDAMADNVWINFTVKFDRDEGVLPALMSIKKAQDYNTDGTITYDNVTYPQYYCYVGNGDTVSSPSDAIRDVIWNALKQSHTRSVRVFRPDEGTDPLTGEGTQKVITASQPWDNDYSAWSDIAVNELDGTTTTIVTD